MLRLIFNVFDEVFFCKSNCKNVLSRFFKERDQFTDSAVAFNKTKKDFFKLQRELMDTLYFFRSANLLTSNTA